MQLQSFLFVALVVVPIFQLAAAAEGQQQQLRSRDLQRGGGRGQGQGEGHGGGGGGGGRGQGGGHGGGGGGAGRGQGGGGGGGHHQTIQSLLDSAERDLIERSSTTEPDGTVITTTTSTDADTADWLVEHVLEMKDLAERGGSIRRWDPLFVQIFDHADEINLTVQDIGNGVKVWLKGSSDCGDALIQKHVRVVDDFVARGRDAAQESHSRSNQC